MNFYATDGCLRLPYPAVPTSLSSGICKTLGYVCVFLEWTTNNNIMQAMSSFFFTGRTTITAVLFVATFAVHYRVLVAVVMSRTMQRTRLFSCACFSVLPVHEL